MKSFRLRHRSNQPGNFTFSIVDTTHPHVVKTCRSISFQDFSPHYDRTRFRLHEPTVGWGSKLRSAPHLCSTIAYCSTASETSSSSTSSHPCSGEAPLADDADPSSEEEALWSRNRVVDAVFDTRYGTRWRVRPYDNRDYAAIVKIQTDSFYTANPVPFLDRIVYNNFRAEVVEGLRQKLKLSDPSVFQLLVAEAVPVDGSSVPDAAPNAQPGQLSNPGEVVGVVEVSLKQEYEVLQALRAPQEAEYAYVSSMCVRSGLRRRGVAQALLAAAELQARVWRHGEMVLHVYKDNVPAVQLYRSSGMGVVMEDPGWKAMLGGRVRYLMYKRLGDGAGAPMA